MEFPECVCTTDNLSQLEVSVPSSDGENEADLIVVDRLAWNALLVILLSQLHQRNKLQARLAVRPLFAFK